MANVETSAHVKTIAEFEAVEDDPDWGGDSDDHLVMVEDDFFEKGGERFGEAERDREMGERGRTRHKKGQGKSELRSPTMTTKFMGDYEVCLTKSAGQRFL